MEGSVFLAVLLGTVFHVQHVSLESDHVYLEGSNIFITLRPGDTRRILTDFSEAPFTTSADKRMVLRRSMAQNAESSQANLLRDLAEVVHVHSSQVTSFWITNQIHVRNASPVVLQFLADRNDVERIDFEPEFNSIKPSRSSKSEFTHWTKGSPREPGSNLVSIRVPEVWDKGVNGTGVIVGIVDTGVHISHEALRDSFKNDTYSWFDPVNRRPEPYDDHGHGTMAMGLLTGGQGIGVAPGAKWIACKARDEDGQPSQLWIIACAQFLFCPDGVDAGCKNTPHVLSIGFNDPDITTPWLDSFVELLDEMDIIVVSSAGDYGERGCKAIGFPAHYPSVLSVGAIDSRNARWSHSSQGPTVKNETVKPDIMAPGVNVTSSCIQLHQKVNGNYCRGSGTSMATSQVAGVAALLRSANPVLKPRQIMEILRQTASQNVEFSGLECGGIPDSTFPNYQFGYGSVDAFAAYECAMDPALSCLPDVSDEGGSSSNRIALWISLGAAGTVTILIVVGGIFFVRARRGRKRKQKAHVPSSASSNPEPEHHDVTVPPNYTDYHENSGEPSLEEVIHQFRCGVWPQMGALRDLATRAHYALDARLSISTDIGNYIALTQPYDFERYEIAIDALDTDKGHVLGSGEFGVVYAGTLREARNGNTVHVQVAVKKLRPGADSDREAVGGFLKELQIMTFVGKHSNIVQLLGACTRASTAEDMCMVLGLCSNGNLEKYLRCRRSVFVDQKAVGATKEAEVQTNQSQTLSKTAQYVTVCDNVPILTQITLITTTDLLRWTAEIAAGMEFLAQKKVVHGDLAARNVLLDENFTVKISDFGLASKLYEYTYANMKPGSDGGSCRALPWRWMALEALKDLKFSTASDVWSFGITVWEVFNLAEVPYPGLAWGEHFLQQLKAGYRNSKPKYATEEMFALISRCWELEPGKRPCMTELRVLFASVLDQQSAKL